MISRSAQYYIPSFVKIRPLVPRFLKGFTIDGHSGHVGHVTSIKLINFHSMYLKAYI